MTGGFVTEGAKRGKKGKGGTHNRLHVSFEPLNVYSRISAELDDRKGRSIVSSKSGCEVPSGRANGSQCACETLLERGSGRP